MRRIFESTNVLNLRTIFRATFKRRVFKIYFSEELSNPETCIFKTFFSEETQSLRHFFRRYFVSTNWTLKKNLKNYWTESIKVYFFKGTFKSTNSDFFLNAHTSAWEPTNFFSKENFAEIFQKGFHLYKIVFFKKIFKFNFF